MFSQFQSVSDEELARQSQAGSLVAFEELVYRYEQRIYGFIANSCANQNDARELTQDSLLRAFQAITQFDAKRSFAPWLFAIARRKCIDYYRTRRPQGPQPGPELADLDDPAELLARRESGASLWRKARQSLPQAQFHALWLRYAEDMEIPQIAQAMRLTRTHVKVLLFRARQKLGRELDRQPLESGRAGKSPPTLALHPSRT